MMPVQRETRRHREQAENLGWLEHNIGQAGTIGRTLDYGTFPALALPQQENLDHWVLLQTFPL